MKGCLPSKCFTILVNGNVKGWFNATRGLRQGDPLSHFLFTITANALSRMLIKAKEDGVLEMGFSLVMVWGEREIIF